VNDREIATLIWLGIGLALALRNAEIRGAIWDMAKHAVHPKLLAPVVAFAGWVGGLVFLAHPVGLWETDVRNDTIAWFLTVGVGLLFSLQRVREDGFFRKTVRRAFAFTVFIEAFMNLGVLPLPVELVLLPAVTGVTVLATFTEGKPEHRPVHTLANRALVVIGTAGFVYVVVRVAADFDAGHTVRALALPVWLTLGSLPFVYVFALLAEYEQAFLRIDSHTDDPVKRRRAKWALVRAAHIRTAEVGGFALHWISDLAAAESRREARGIARRWRKTWRSERHADRMTDARVYMEEWLTQTDPTLQEVWADSVQRSWDRLDGEQRATLKADAIDRAADPDAAEAVRSLPD
jgi:hypothetical protein